MLARDHAASNGYCILLILLIINRLYLIRCDPTVRIYGLAIFSYLKIQAACGLPSAIADMGDYGIGIHPFPDLTDDVLIVPV